MGNFPHRLIRLDTWSPAGNAVFGREWYEEVPIACPTSCLPQTNVQSRVKGGYVPRQGMCGGEAIAAALVGDCRG